MSKYAPQFSALLKESIILVKGVGGVQYTIFCPSKTLEQVNALNGLKARLIEVFGGVTELGGLGYWQPPKGVGIDVEDVKVLVLVVHNEPASQTHADIVSLLEDYFTDSGEQQVLMTRNNADIIYINKE